MTAIVLGEVVSHPEDIAFKPTQTVVVNSNPSSAIHPAAYIGNVAPEKYTYTGPVNQPDGNYRSGGEDCGEPSTGRCCYGDPGAPDCEDGITYEDCYAIHGDAYDWDAGEVCPCPVVGDNDVCETAAGIPSLPYNATGNTCDFNDDYDEECPSASNSPDVVYVYTHGADMCVDITLCNGSDYDTKLYVYENECQEPDDGVPPYACNDDACPGYVSEILGLALTGGNTYYIVIDGYSSYCGNYVLDVTECAMECVVECPPGATMESEPCGSDMNGGCNMEPGTQTWEPIGCGETVCGTIWASDGTRDTDWYEVVMTSPGTMTWTCEAEFDVVIGYIAGCPDGIPDCSCVTGLNPYITGGCNEVISVEYEATVPGTYWFFVSHQDYYDLPCGYENDYVVTLNCDSELDLVSNLLFEQMDFYDQNGTLVTPNSDWGQLSFDVTPMFDDVVRYMNISAVAMVDTGWIVRNFPILPGDIIDPGRCALHFDFNELGVSSGTDVSSLQYVMAVSSAIQTSGPIGTMTPTNIYDIDISRFGSYIPGGDYLFEGPSVMVPPYYTSEVDTDSLIKHKDLGMTGVPSVQEDDDECASGSTARSLKWLSNEHNLGLGTAQSIQEELDNPEYMNQGVTDKEQLIAKKKYIDDNNLPLEVHYWYSNSVYPTGVGTPGIPSENNDDDDIDLKSWLWRELKKGQDIELTISWFGGGGHSVTLVGLDKKNNKIEYRDDETQGDNTKGDKAVKETALVPLGECVVGPNTYITSEDMCTQVGGTWGGLNGDYGFDAHNDIIKTGMAESPKSFDMGWRYHPKYVDGWLTVYGTIDCQTYEPPIFERTYVEYCTTYEGYIPLWANDYLIIFEWDWFCNNVDSFKVADPYWDGEYWRLYPFGPWLEDNLPPGGMILPTIGDETGETRYIHTVVNPSEWLADPREPLPYYTIIDGECDDLPGYLIGTTPITFDPFAPPSENPFSTTPFTGELTYDGDLIFGQAETYVCGDADGSGFVDIDDVVHLINYIFAGGPAPVPLAAGDADCSGFIDIDDVVYLINYIFAGGPPPGDPDGDGVPDC